MTEKHFVVVDGSNLATEGRKTPSLAQLDEAVRAYVGEHPDAEMVVVVDASFEHRIDPKEARKLEQAELHGELVSPPAGAIGRGDAFVLRIAERTGATVLSNDSFQEFHDQHPWLFDQGRLIGGKPVPGVGWIFTERTPVRGAKSRHADRKGKARGRVVAEMAPVDKAAELAKAAKRAAQRGVVRNGDGSTPSVGDVWVGTAGSDDGGEPAKSTRATRAAKDTKAAVADATAADRDDKDKKPKKKDQKKDVHAEPTLATPPPAKALRHAKAAKSQKVAAAAKAPKAAEPAPAPARTKVTKATGDGVSAPKAKKAPAKKAAPKKTASKEEESAPTVAKSTTAAKAAKPAKAGTTTKASKATKVKKTAPEAPVPSARKRTNRRVRAAIVDATAEALEPEVSATDNGASTEAATNGAGEAGGKRKRRRADPPPAVNEPMAFINFVAAYPMGGEVAGEVTSFTSHGAMVEVPVPDGSTVYCYIPLAGMATPPPVKARDVLARGEHRTFVLVALDAARRVAELALPEVVSPPKPAKPKKTRAAARR